MNKDFLFSEKQYFKQWWLILLLFGIAGIFIFGFIKQNILGEQFGNKPMSNTALLITNIICILFIILFSCIRLDTHIKADGIYVRFFPFSVNFKHYSWSIIKSMYIREYAPLKEYGGWGLRYGTSGKALTVSGRNGLQLELNNNSKLLIGTNKPEEITKVLELIKEQLLLAET